MAHGVRWSVGRTDTEETKNRARTTQTVNDRLFNCCQMGLVDQANALLNAGGGRQLQRSIGAGPMPPCLHAWTGWIRNAMSCDFS